MDTQQVQSYQEDPKPACLKKDYTLNLTLTQLNHDPQTLIMPSKPPKTESNPSPIPDTNPQKTSTLWRSIRRTVSKTDDDDDDDNDDDDDGASPSGSETPARKRRRTTSRSSQAEARLSSPDFETTVLHPRGVQIIPYKFRAKRTTAAQQFRVQRAPQEHKRRYYGQRPALQHSRIWANGGAATAHKLAQAYEAAQPWRLSARRYANLALRHFFSDELLQRNRAARRMFLCERVDEEPHQPDFYAAGAAESDWRSLPVLDAETQTLESNSLPFAFDLVPDSVYWLNMQTFPAPWAEMAERSTHVRDNRLLAPYLSVTYRYAAAEEAALARKHVACLAALCVYNRFELRAFAKRCRAAEPCWSETDVRLTRHYAITLVAHRYNVFVAEARVARGGEWRGVLVKWLDMGDLKLESSVEALVDWVNEIHRWGLTTYAAAVREDVEAQGVVETRTRSRPARGETRRERKEKWEEESEDPLALCS
ncbi:uncharacterized protein K452DRAFT_312100 [Aplosporella prunicola CBS 121167]|uniref:Uncharacterized protein n=1 Tax=Aplosporella prunicola CBS 121167 TaxID=1176127 RepID=A0A6A6B3C3_9PEZI|nr:uncharacterized protein K452DRAFT_312100 [Aplosporella prunicola CBS 121167]KAF2137714.1 hypothetical protein K452DRAFT_312100 [Aplosporella prunicola CBS 121167]